MPQFPQIAATVLGGLLVAAGLAVLVLSRRGRGGGAGGPRVHLAGVGPLSPITMTVAALAAAGAGYHLVVHALHIPHFRAPLPIALGVAAVAVLGSIAVDAVENRKE